MMRGKDVTLIVWPQEGSRQEIRRPLKGEFLLVNLIES